MGFKHSNKINKIRTFALSLVFIGIGIMYLGILVKQSMLFMSLLMLIGFIAVISSALVYAWIGVISTKAVQVTCPNCEKTTKVLGRVDACMHCKEPLTLDPSLEGEPFDPSYNQKKAQKS